MFATPTVSLATPRRRRFFNTTGPCDPAWHYMLPPEERLQNAQLHRYVTVEYVQGIAEPERAMPTICDAVRNGASDIGLPVPARPAAGARKEGLEQISRYRDRLGASIPCFLIIFDRRSNAKSTPWEQRLSWETDKTPTLNKVNAEVTIVGC